MWCGFVSGSSMTAGPLHGWPTRSVAPVGRSETICASTGSGSTTTSTNLGFGAEYVERGGGHIAGRSALRHPDREPSPHRIDGLHDERWLRRQVEEGRTQRQIAYELDCSRTASHHGIRLSGEDAELNAIL